MHGKKVEGCGSLQRWVSRREVGSDGLWVPGLGEKGVCGTGGAWVREVGVGCGEGVRCGDIIGLGVGQRVICEGWVVGRGGEEG